MKVKGFLAYLRQNVVLFDGAMGTMLYSKGIYVNRCYDELNLSQPRIVREIHQAYADAGADVLETNTFGANRYKLGCHGYAEDLAAVNYQGARLACEVAGSDLWVAGSLGPLGLRLEPWGPTAYEEARAAFREQARSLLDGGVDLFIIETISDMNEIREAILGIREISGLPIVAQMTISEEGVTPYGTTPEVAVQKMAEWGADVVGLNCGVGPQMMLTALQRMIVATDKPLIIQPNAGLPKNIEGRNIYLSSAEYMAEYAKRFILTGAKAIGGCCGTTPEYIHAMRNAIRAIAPGKRKTGSIVVSAGQPTVVARSLDQKSPWGAKIARRQFITSVEIVPPRGIDVERAVSTVELLQAEGIDAVNIPEGPRALSRMGAVYLSKILQDRLQTEVISHYTCRDRNLLGIMSDLLGIHAMGIRNLLLVTGDPPKMGNLPEATAVFDVDSIGLVNVVHTLNRGLDLGNNPIGDPTEFVIGVGVNPGAIDPDYELRRFEWKVKAGAEYAITQPVFDIAIFERFLEQVKSYNIPIIAGIWPLVSLRNAEFMNNEVPGAHVPQTILESMRKASSREAALEIGLQIARETIDTLFPRVQGIQLAIPLGRVDLTVNLLKRIRRLKQDQCLQPQTKKTMI